MRPTTNSAAVMRVENDVEGDNFAPGTRLDRHVQRTQSEDGGQEKGEHDAAENQAQPQSRIRGTRSGALGTFR